MLKHKRHFVRHWKLIRITRLLEYLESVSKETTRSQEQQYCDSETRQGARSFHNRCGHDTHPTSSLSSSSPPPTRSSKPSSTTRRDVKGATYVFENPQSETWIGYTEKEYSYFEGHDVESAIELLSSRLEEIPKEVNTFFSDCKSRNELSITNSGFVVVGSGQDATLSSYSHRVYCNVESIGRAVVIRDGTVKTKEYQAVYDESKIRSYLKNVSIEVHHTLRYLSDDPDITCLDVHQDRIEISRFRCRWTGICQQHERSVADSRFGTCTMDVERMQFGRTSQGRYYITFYYVSDDDDDDVVVSENELEDPVQKLLDLRGSGKLNMLSPMERLALAQDLTISTSMSDFGDMSRHVLSLQKLFESERHALSRLRGHEGKILNDIITRLREIEAEASFSIMRMQNIDRIRNADAGVSVMCLELM